MAKKKADGLTNIQVSKVSNHISSMKYVNNDWGTIAFGIPRNELKQKFLDKELRYNGIYFLIGYDEMGTEQIYVGQAKKRQSGESILARLREHDDSITEKYRDKWDYVIAVTGKDDTWSLDDLNALENAFYHVIPIEQNLNGNTPNSAGANFENYIDKIRQIKSYISLVGFHSFDEDDEETKETIQLVEVVDEQTAVEDLQKGMSRIPEIVTPHRVVKAMVDMLPPEVWNPTTKFLDLACKGGEYLREIYDRLMSNELMQAEFPDLFVRSNHILLNQIYGIAQTPASLERTTKKLLGCGANIKIIPNYIHKVKGENLGSFPDGRAKTITDVIKDVFWSEKEIADKMKFDVVIGNPPYQESTGSGLNESGGTALFDKFISSGIDTSHRIVCMITPTKWIAGNQKDFVALRAKLLEGNHIAKMVDYMNAKDIFPGRSIAGGVSYFIYDKQSTTQTEFTTVVGDTYTSIRNFSKHGIIPRHSVGESVIDKIKAIDKQFLSNHIYKNKWQLPTNFSEGSIVRQSEDDVKIITPQGEFYVDPEEYELSDTNWYKVMFTRVVTGSAVEPDKNNTYKILSSLKVIEPNEICNASYMVVAGIGIREHAENIKAYMETKFVRFLVLQTLFGIGLTADRFQFVPLQDFSKVWTDQMLYEKYNLTSEEIDFIEKIISPMNPEQPKQTIKLTRQEVEAMAVNKLLQGN